MPRLVEQVVCPSCGRHQSLKSGQSLPPGWFSPDVSYAERPFIFYQRAYGGQGRGVKGKDVKALSGFVLEQQYNLHEAWMLPETKPKVQALYKSAKALVAFLEEEVGVR